MSNAEKVTIHCYGGCGRYITLRRSKVCMHRDSHAQPFAHLGKAWTTFFADLKAGKQAHEPRFKKKGRCRDSFYVATPVRNGCGQQDAPGQEESREHIRSPF